MGRGRGIYLSYTALVLMSAVSTTTASIWDVSIDESPAPPPDKGPPFSANASRNLALLPYQIIGVAGAYIGSVLIVGLFVLTCGRTLRKRAQSMASEPREMVKPLSRTFERSPTSPNDSRHWYSPRRLREKRSNASSVGSNPSNQASPGMDSVVSFDSNVLEADRLKRLQDMERLYAAVMAQDEQRSMAQQNVTALPQLSPDKPPPEYSTRKPPPRLITDDPTLKHLQSTRGGETIPITPITPKSPVRAIYPPDSNLPPGPSSPTSPIRAEYAAWPKPSQLEPKETHSREPSFSSGRTAVSGGSGSTSAQKKLRKSIRNLKISAPIIRVDDNSDGARTPLSPRFYADPGVPPEPPTGGTQRSAGYPPTTPGTAGSARSGWHQLDEDMDQVRDLPQPNPQRLATHNYMNEAQMVTDAASTRPDPTRNRAVGNGTLPLRELNRQYAQQQMQQGQGSPSAQTAKFPLSPSSWNATSPTHAYVTSAGPVKTTFLEARKDGLSAPRTGVPTPYSPYMPFTPLTPVTPHLMSKAERKQREKEQRKARRPIMEEDAVAEEEDLWSSGY